MKDSLAKIVSVRITSLQWAIAAFCSSLGALMLVAPHQFNSPDYAALQNNLIAWGVAFFLAGWVIFIISIYPIPNWMRFTFHLGVAGMMLFLAYGFAVRGFWLWLLNYLLLGMAMLVVALRRYTPLAAMRKRPTAAQLDLLALFFALDMLFSAVLFLFFPQLFSDPRYLGVSRSLYLIGLMFLVGSIGLVIHMVLVLRSSQGYNLGYPFAGGILLIYMVLVPVQLSLWPGILYYGGFGSLLILIPLLQRRTGQLNPALLRTRLALLLALATAVPLVTTVSLISYQEERSVTSDLLTRQEAEAATLAEGISQYIGLHRAALSVLANDPGLLNRSPQDLHQYLKRFASPYPDVTAFTVFDAAGKQIARSDDAKPISIGGFPLFEEARRTHQPASGVLTSATYHVPIFAFTIPLFDANGNMTGLVSMAVSSNTIANYLSNMDPDTSIVMYMVDQRGRVIAHDEHTIADRYNDYSSRPPVKAFFASQYGNGSMIFNSENTDHLAGYARVPDQNWAVVIERPVDEALAGVYAGRNTAFAVLVGFLFLTTLAGIVMAGWVAAPLQRLKQASAQLANGNSQIAMPSSHITEIQDLARVFDEMRYRLEVRTSEREHAQAALRLANEELESKVIERTADLELANRSLETYARALIESNRELQDFAHIASHDLQEPLRKIRAFGDRLLAHADGLDDESRDYIGRMQNAATRMQAMIDGLLAYSRVSTKAQPQVPVDLNKVACEVLSDLEVRIEQTGGKVELGRLPQVTADPLQMRQLLQNLIGNALKFHKPGEFPVVKVHGQLLDGGLAELVVEDNGIGFDPQFADRLFQPFTRLANRNEYEGSGIGLAICRKIVERHSGQIIATGQPGQGSKFVVQIPARQIADHL